MNDDAPRRHILPRLDGRPHRLALGGVRVGAVGGGHRQLVNGPHADAAQRLLGRSAFLISRSVPRREGTDREIKNALRPRRRCAASACHF